MISDHRRQSTPLANTFGQRGHPPAVFPPRSHTFPNVNGNFYNTHPGNVGASEQVSYPPARHSIAGPPPRPALVSFSSDYDVRGGPPTPVSFRRDSCSHVMHDGIRYMNNRPIESPRPPYRPSAYIHGPHHSWHGTSSSADSDMTSMDGGPAPHQIMMDVPLTTSPNAGGDSFNNDPHDGQAGGPAPAWSETKTKAGKERKRLPLACVACRRKKIRCSGEKPACKHCLRSRIPCVYKVTVRKAAPRTDYMAMLDKRLKRMEERVIKIIPKEEQGILATTGRATVKPVPSTLVGRPANKRLADEAFEDDLDEWVDSAGIIIKPRDDNGLPADERDRMQQEAEEESLLQEGADKLPSANIQEHLAEIFFDFVYGQSYHLLHKPSFMRKLAQGAVPPVLMLAVCAVAARFSDHPDVRTEPAFLRGEEWARPAREISFRRYDRPSITILTVYLILGLHEFGTCHGGRSWMLGGMAQRMAYALQLHREPEHLPTDAANTDKAPQLSLTDREIQRRTMWSCFLMDRFNSSGSGRPIFVQRQYIRTQLPVKESMYLLEVTGPTEDLEGNAISAEAHPGVLTDTKDNMGVAAYLIRMVAIWGTLIDYMNLGGKDRDPHPMWAENSKFAEINHQITQWQNTLPRSLQYNKDNLRIHVSQKIANQFIFLHIVYQQVLLFMNRFALPTPAARATWPEDMPEHFRAEAARVALESAIQISRLAQESLNHNVVAPFAGYAAFYSSTVHIPLALSKNPQQAALSKACLSSNVKFLSKMQRFWGMFSYVSENLKELYRRHAGAVRSGQPDKEVEAAIFQYGDWYDRYPHGIVEADVDASSSKSGAAQDTLGQKSDLQTVEEFFSRLSAANKAPGQAQKGVRKHARTRSEQVKSTPHTEPRLIRTHSHGSEDAIMEASDENRSFNPTAGVEHDLASLQFAQGSDSNVAHQNATQYSSEQIVGEHTPTRHHVGRQLSDGTREMFLNAYPHMQEHANNAMPQVDPSIPNPMLNQLDTSMYASFNPAAFPPAHDQSGGDFWGDPSTAWYMPFNLEPPEDPSMLVPGAAGGPMSGNVGPAVGGMFDWNDSFGMFPNQPAEYMPENMPQSAPLELGPRDEQYAAAAAAAAARNANGWVPER